MGELTAEVLGGPRCVLGEGPAWHAEADVLGWVDILGKQFHSATLDANGALGEVRTVDVGDHLGAAVPVASGGWLLCMGTGFAHLADDGSIAPLAQPEAAYTGEIRMNDAKCDPRGRLWAGSMAFDESQRRGTLYRVGLDGAVTAMVAPVGVSNGLGWTPDLRTMFYADTGDNTISAFPFEAEAGSLGERRVIFRGSGDARPDGMSTDDSGEIWAAFWDSGTIRHLDGAGADVSVVRVPVQRTSSCCFAGPNRDLLVITTGQLGDDDDPDAGRLFVVRPGVTGPAATAFAGTLPR